MKPNKDQDQNPEVHPEDGAHPEGTSDKGRREFLSDITKIALGGAIGSMGLSSAASAEKVGGVDPVRVKLTGTSPAEGEELLSDQDWLALFDGALKGNSVNTTTAYVVDDLGKTHETKVSLRNGSVIQVTPLLPYPEDRCFTLFLTKGIVDTLGRSISEEYAVQALCPACW